MLVYVRIDMFRSGEVPVNPSQRPVQAKRRGVFVALFEDAMAMLDVGRVDSIVDTYDDDQHPRKRDEDAICRESRRGMRFPARKWVV